MTVKAVFFDLDGTLVDSNDFHVRAWDLAFREHGIVLDPTAIHDQIGKGTDNFVPALVPGSDEAATAALGEAHGRLFKQRYLERVRPFPGARELALRVDRAGARVVLATSASRAEVDHYIALLDIGAVVAATTSADEVENTKPAPDIFSRALAKVAPLTAAECIVLGDTPYDIEAAARCDIAAIGLRSGGFAGDDLLGAGAVAVYDDVAALLARFDGSPLAR